jgi:type IV secretory pathway TrbF-like protein
MSPAETKSPEITRAAERYLEQYGDPMVMNTYLKVTVLVLAAICLMLGVLTYKSQLGLVNMKPFIVRVSDTGRAEAIDYKNYQYKPQEAENKYYLARWATLYFERNRYTIERDQTAALYFLNGDVQHVVIEREQRDKTISKFSADASLPYVDIDVKNIILDDLHESPYTARIEYDKVFTNAVDHSEVRREHWTASVTYVFADHVANEALSVNPLGLTIVRFRTDQAFS